MGPGTAAERALQSLLQAHSEKLILCSQRLYAILDEHSAFQALAEEACAILGAQLCVVLWPRQSGFAVEGAVAATGGKLVGIAEADRELATLQEFAASAIESSSPVARDNATTEILGTAIRTNA
jgi:GAF domain-containing protein